MTSPAPRRRPSRAPHQQTDPLQYASYDVLLRSFFSPVKAAVDNASAAGPMGSVTQRVCQPCASLHVLNTGNRVDRAYERTSGIGRDDAPRRERAMIGGVS